MRIIDEMTYSTEEREKDVGIVAEGFAYQVIGGPLLDSVSEAAKFSYKPLSHFAFISLDNCLEVIANSFPQFDLIDL
jgi:hypothetical protein